MSSIVGKALLLAVSASLTAGCQQGEPQSGDADNRAQVNTTAENTGPSESIGQALSQSADHSNFVSAVKAAGLDGTLAGSQPYTVFAPSNAAFEKLPQGAAQNMMQPEQKGELTTVVTHHIVPGVVTAQDLTRAIERSGGKAQIATVGGGNLTATRNGGTIMLQDANGGRAQVTPSDQAHSNGVFHSIDTVLMPS